MQGVAVPSYPDSPQIKPVIGVVAGLCIVVSLGNITGWVFNIPILTTMLPGFSSMKMNSAICFLLSGIGLALVHSRPTSKIKFMLSVLCSAAVLLISGFSLLQYLADINFGIDEWLVTDKQSHLNGLAYPGRMAMITCGCFITLHIGGAFNFSSLKIIRNTGEVLLYLTASIGLLIVLGYLYGIRNLNSLGFNSTVSAPTGLLFTMLSLAVVFLMPDKGFAALITGSYTGSLMARKLIPQFIAMGLLLGLLRTYTYGHNQMNEALSIAAAVIIYAGLATALVWITANTLNTLDKIRTEAEKQLEATNRSLEEKNQELNLYNHAVAHDLKTPLRAISCYSTMLQNEHSSKLNDEARRYLDAIEQSSFRMETLINDLLRFSGIGTVTLQKTPTDMNQLVSDALKDFEPQKAYKKVKWIIHPLNSTVCDVPLIRSVWVNLISNAIKFSQGAEQPVIEIGMMPFEGSMAYYIKDNGIGFDMKYAGKLFNVFERLHAPEEYEGTGVGLAISAKIIERHGGNIRVQSKLNQGAMFCFTLPSA